MSDESVYLPRTAKVLGRVARWHWNTRDRAVCIGVPLAVPGERPELINPEDRCRSNGCRQRWARFDRERVAGGAS